MAVTAVAQPASALSRDEHMTDTRTPSPVQRENSGDAHEDAYKPDLSNEVAMLSTKLINAINYNTNLDDSLQTTRHELEQARAELRKVRAEKQSLDDAITKGVLVKKSEVDATMAKLRADMAQEKAQRENAEKVKKQTEGELENLTSALFEEANTMVAAARKDTEAVEKRNLQLKGQLRDTEDVIESQQEQLKDLKTTMEKLERVDTSGRDSSMPSTPINATTAAWDALQLSPHAAGAAEITPEHPLYFSQLVAPVLRTDISAYNDFTELFAPYRRGAPHYRAASGNAASTSQTNLSITTISAAATASSPNIPGAFSFGSSSASNSPSSSTFANAAIPPLKDTKFYKRALTEDLEPTLRLDLAPGLSFLSRRTVLSSLLNGSLAVEPFVPTRNFYGVFACALCGESRRPEPYTRKYRFRTSESEDAQRYPLCDYCLGRIRATGDFVGFLRMVRDGHWRCDSEEEQKGAWGEAVRLRERMFWARLGGGVVPAMTLRRPSGAEAGQSPSTAAGIKSVGRPSLESSPEDAAETEILPEEAQHISEGHEGIGRALVNMASRAATSAVPELQPQQRGRENSARAADDDSEGFQTPSEEKENVGPVPPAQSSDVEQTKSQKDQAEAEAQLQQETDAAETATQAPEAGAEQMQSVAFQIATPVPEVDEGEQPKMASRPASPEKATSRPASLEKAISRPTSPEKSLSSSPQRSSNSSPTRPQTRGSGSGASGVLARVRAMEAKAQGTQ